MTQPYPTPDNILVLKMITPLMGEAILYCGQEAIERNLPGCIAYDANNDTLTYHLAISDLDSSLFDMLKGAQDVWIEVGARTDG